MDVKVPHILLSGGSIVLTQRDALGTQPLTKTYRQPLNRTKNGMTDGLW
jgi:hypothetical protein